MPCFHPYLFLLPSLAYLSIYSIFQQPGLKYHSALSLVFPDPRPQKGRWQDTEKKRYRNTEIEREIEGEQAPEERLRAGAANCPGEEVTSATSTEMAGKFFKSPVRVPDG